MPAPDATVAGASRRSATTGARFSRNARMPSVRVVGLRVLDHDAARERVRVGFAAAFLRVERALAERDDVGARAQDALRERRRSRRRARRQERPG